ncbi:30S ribosomal protein S8 [Candidatus Azambacteria bacterium]|nr:30S ribosomal protein S8 [Candidatus Azambacteria bacterium]
MTDPISDMLTRIRNANILKRDSISIPHSKIKFEIAKVLSENKFVGVVSRKGRKIKKFLEIKLLNENGVPSLTGLRRMSRPSQRLYVKSDEIRSVRSGHGLVIISTSKGLMSNKEAKKVKLGGELICEVW